MAVSNKQREGHQSDKAHHPATLNNLVYQFDQTRLHHMMSDAQRKTIPTRVGESAANLKPLAYTSFDGDHMRYMYWMCHVGHALGFVPINPEAALGAYISIHAHNGIKGELIRDCIALEMCCDEFWIFDTPDQATLHKMPEGVLAELMLWRSGHSHGLVRHFPWLEPGGAVKHRSQLEPRSAATRQRTLNQAVLPHEKCDQIIAITSEKSVQELHRRVIDPVRRDGLRPLVFISQDVHDFKHADWARAMAFRHGHVPLCPDTLLNPFAADAAHGLDADHAFFFDRASVLQRAEELWLFLNPRIRLGEPDHALPDTVAFDLLYWLTHKPTAPIRAFSWRDAGVPKYAKRDWALTSLERGDVTF